MIRLGHFTAANFALRFRPGPGSEPRPRLPKDQPAKGQTQAHEKKEEQTREKAIPDSGGRFGGKVCARAIHR